MPESDARQFDVRHIVPSTRDLLQALSTRRNNLAIIGEISSGDPAAEARRLDEANVSALAFAAADSAMLDGASAIKNAPVLCLSLVTTRKDCQRARFFGADGVCIDVAMPPDQWDLLAKAARAMRMLPVALARTAEQVDGAMKAGARALLLRAGSLEEVTALASKLPRHVTLIADIAGEEDSGRVASKMSDADVRGLARKVDSAILPPAVHASAGFGDLVAEVDP
jgi:indole-3-glycerol phosphate synthase